MTAYIFKSSLSLIILFGLYWFLLRKEKLFVFNRYFLLISVVISLIIPFISIPVNFRVTPLQEYAIPASGNFVPEISKITNNQRYTEIPSSSINISVILSTIYFSGVLLFLFRLLRNMYVIIRKIKISEKIRYEGYRIVLTDEKAGPCCFFHSIFMNRDDYLNDRIDRVLLEHEREHARQSHTIDVMLIELLKIFYWFNPVYLLYDRAIRINHEYLADYGAIGDKSDIKNYAEKLLSFITCKSNLLLASRSAQSFAKKRLTMMMKSEPKGIVTGTRLIMTLFIGLIFFLLLSFKKSENLLSPSIISETGLQQNTVKGIVLTEDREPLMSATIIVAIPGNTPANIRLQTGEDGHFKLKNIQKEDSLLISGIGYKVQTLKPDFTSEMIITMEKDPNEKSDVMAPDAKYIHEAESVAIKVTEDTEPFRNDSLRNIDDYDTNGAMGENSNNLQEKKTLSSKIKTSDQDPVPILFDTWKVTLRPGVTMSQYVDFLKTKLVPEYDKDSPQSKLFIACRGTWLNQNIYAFCYYFESWKVYYRYYPTGTEMSPERKAVMDRLKQENSKYILDMERVETDLPGNWFWDMLDSLQRLNINTSVKLNL